MLEISHIAYTWFDEVAIATSPTFPLIVGNHLPMKSLAMHMPWSLRVFPHLNHLLLSIAVLSTYAANQTEMLLKWLQWVSSFQQTPALQTICRLHSRCHLEQNESTSFIVGAISSRFYLTHRQQSALNRMVSNAHWAYARISRCLLVICLLKEDNVKEDSCIHCFFSNSKLAFWNFVLTKGTIPNQTEVVVRLHCLTICLTGHQSF